MVKKRNSKRVLYYTKNVYIILREAIKKERKRI
jgi:hypothetical protein